MDDNELLILERIAVALERIANSMDNQNVSDLDELNCNSDVVETKVCEHVEIDVNVLIDKLSEKGIGVKSFLSRDDENNSLDAISKFMGNKYSTIKRVYELMKKHLNMPYGFRLDLRNATQTEISDSCQFCTLLYQIAFLSEYRYDKSPKFCIHATPNKIPVAINFLTGHWLENFVKAIILDYLEIIPEYIEYTYLINPQIVLPNGDDFELDVVFLINDEIYWIEAKTGNYQNYVGKYSSVSDLMDLDDNHSFMVLTDLPNPSSVDILSRTFKMNVVSVEDFEETLKSILVI